MFFTVRCVDLCVRVLSPRDVVLKLLQFEASTSLADSKGCFPLHLAAWRGDVDIVRILLQHGSSHCRVNQQVNAAIDRCPQRRLKCLLVKWCIALVIPFLLWSVLQRL